jgi:hypothetical protein
LHFLSPSASHRGHFVALYPFLFLPSPTTFQDTPELRKPKERKNKKKTGRDRKKLLELLEGYGSPQK